MHNEVLLITKPEILMYLLPPPSLSKEECIEAVTDDFQIKVCGSSDVTLPCLEYELVSVSGYRYSFVSFSFLLFLLYPSSYSSPSYSVVFSYHCVYSVIECPDCWLEIRRIFLAYTMRSTLDSWIKQ
jgi:hypothetical protein